ncbi:MAG: 1-deoxy-D-xylulose-5-phosphate synthase [Halanaerobium sp.]|nr:1-deoxy-D-xylulose-5-phosphate synthase [Halanaerobium sp.]
MELLSEINSPKDLKELDLDQLQQLAEEIRTYIIEVVSHTGGHLASNLGVVELTLALHFCFNSPRDQIIWDVGHQSYVHKILTGRREDFPTIRQHGGLSGFPKREESPHDIVETGHSSTSISFGVGLSQARDLLGGDNKVIAVIGDGALTGGMALEALNHAGDLGNDLLVILNDNEMSIAPNVGALANYLSEIRTDPLVQKVKDDVENLISKIPAVGKRTVKTLEQLKTALKYSVITGALFEELGFKYLGPIDGHDIPKLVHSLQKASLQKGPVLLHTLTKKGKGYQPAEKHPESFHGTSPFKIETGEPKSSKSAPSYSKVFGEALVEFASTDNRVTAITAAMPEGTGLNYFAEKFPERLYDVGIAEQHAVTMAAGLAQGGLKPVVAVYSTFLQRAYDQVIHDLCMPKLPVLLAIDRAGLVGSDGETHHGAFDLSFLRSIPNMSIMAPAHELELKRMLFTALQYEEGPVAIRYPRGSGPGIFSEDAVEPIPWGRGKFLKEGKDVTLLAIGSMVYPALKVAEKLDIRGYNTGVVNLRFLKPLDKEIILAAARESRFLVTLEENSLAGGMGSAVLETLEENRLRQPVKRIGLPDRFIRHGTQDELLADLSMDITGLEQTITSWVKRMQQELVEERYGQKKGKTG